jgi:protein-S-isoprenylcysteine O-methyltransferase Ste14
VASEIGDFVARTTVWLVAVSLWLSLNKPDDAGLLPAWAGVPTLLGASLILAGISLYSASAVTLARAKRDSLGAPETLLTQGPFGYVRNPVYLSIGVIVVGLSLLYHVSQISAVKTVLLLIGGHLAVVFLEEPATRQRFGAAYDDYRRRVPRWVPRRSKM